MKKLILCAGAAWCVLFIHLNPGFAQGTAFTYQGRLDFNGTPANGGYNLAFTLYNTNTNGSPIAPPVTNNGVVVSNGLFTALVDFGPGVFIGGSNWLELGVASNGSANFTILVPRQLLTPTPYAITAGNLSGSVAVSQLPDAVVTNGAGGSTLSNLTLNGALTLPSFASGSDILYSGGDLLLYADDNYNFFAGPQAGNVMMVENNAAANSGTGFQALFGNSTGSGNTASGYLTMAENATGNDNSALGATALQYNLTGSQNTAVGEGALYLLGFHGQINSGKGGGTNNIALGFQAGFNLTNNESSNIDIGNAGQANENQTIRLGTPGTHTNTIIAGVINGNGGGLTNTTTSANYVFAYDTTAQLIFSAFNEQTITFNTTARINGWTHTAGTAPFTCTQAGLYLVQYTADLSATASVLVTVSLRATVNSTTAEIAGSQSAVTLTAVAVPEVVSKSFLSSFNAGDVMYLEMEASANSAAELVGNGSGTTVPGISCTIIRIQ